MKQRLLVMNGHRIIQAEHGDEWTASKVDKAPVGLKPGIYNLYAAANSEIGKTYAGVILHADKNDVYQQVGKSIVKHDKATFSKGDMPEVGETKSISYDAKGKATVDDNNVSLKKGLKR